VGRYARHSKFCALRPASPNLTSVRKPEHRACPEQKACHITAASEAVRKSADFHLLGNLTVHTDYALSKPRPLPAGLSGPPPDFAKVGAAIRGEQGVHSATAFAVRFQIDIVHGPPIAFSDP